MILLVSDNLGTVIGILFSIMSIIISIYIYFIERKYKQISYMYQTTNLLSKEHFIDKLSFLYDGKRLESIAVTDVIIWCNGKELINKTDIAPTGSLTIHSPSEILNYYTIFSNDPCNNFKIIQKNNNLLIDFDYMEKNNGISIKIIHTESTENFYVSCKVKGGRKTVFVNHRKGFFYTFLNHKMIKFLLSKKITSFIFIFFTIFLFPIAFIQSSNYANNNFFGLPNTNIFMNLDSIIILFLCICSFLLAIPHIYNLFKNEPPNDLINRTSCER